jgi:hypothetical protein
MQESHDNLGNGVAIVLTQYASGTVMEVSVISSTLQLNGLRILTNALHGSKTEAKPLL